MNAAIYARVSTDEQAENGYSIISQLEACRNYANEHGLKVAEEIKDDYTGTLLDRPGLEQIRTLASNREIDAVIVYSSDRWTRNLAHKLILREEFLSLGIDLHYVNRGRSQDTPENRMVENIEGVFDEYWREKIIEGCKRGKNAKAKDNKPVMSGIAPYGYRKKGSGKNATYVIDEHEGEVVKNLFEWYVYGDGTNGPLSFHRIARKLEEIGEPTPKNHGRNAKYWVAATIRGIIRNDIYRGITYFGKTRVINKKVTKQPSDKWIKIDVPELAIIDSKLFKKAKSRSEKNKELAKRNRKRDYLVTGFLKCGACNHAMAGNTHRGLFYYRCSSYWAAPDRCSNINHMVSGPRIESEVWEWVKNLFNDEDRLRLALARMTEQNEEQIGPKRERLDLIDNLIGGAESKIRKLATSLTNIEEDYIRDVIIADMKALSKQRESILKERQSLLDELSQTDALREQYERILSQASEVRRKMVDPSYENKRAILDALNFRGIYRSDTAGRWLDVSCELVPEGDLIAISTY